MPGIAGIIGGGSPQANRAMLQQMVGSMCHEPFYHSGTFADETAGAYLGWVALPGSFSDRMPVWNEAKDICVIFRGEDFSDPSAIADLRRLGHEFEPDAAGYLVHMYEEFGPGFLERLNGIFSGVVVDLRRRKTLLFNDRYGLSRIYYHETRDAFYFASEAKALLKALPSLRSLDVRSLGEFFSCGCPLQNRTYFSGVSLLPGASSWTFPPEGGVSKGLYFCPDLWEKQPPLADDACFEQLRETFARILPRYFRGRQPVAISLTGGVDSRMVMAWAGMAPGTLPTFTFGGPFRDCIDVRTARRVAEICGQSHRVIPVGDDFLRQFPDLAESTVFAADGAMDMTGTPDMYVNRIAREIAPVRMTGNYGGEILRSLVAFKPTPVSPELFNPEFADCIRLGTQTYAEELNGRKLSFVAFKQVPWHHYSRLAVELSQISVRSPYLDNDLVALAYRFPAHLASSNDLSLRLIHEGNPALSRLGTDRGILYQPLPLLTRLNHTFQEFTFKAEYAYDYGMPHWLARLDKKLDILHFEKLLLGRHKFYHFRLWYRDQLSGYVKDILLDNRARKRPYIDGRHLEQSVKKHAAGEGNYTLAIHRLLTAELLQRLLIEG